jgi:tetratricopeptide (TPR) repeat protein
MLIIFKMMDSNLELLARFQNLDRLWNPADIAASEAAFQALLPDAHKLTGKDRSFLVELLSLIGRAEAFREKFAQARSSLEEAGKLLDEQQVHYLVSARIRWLLEKGRLYVLEKTPSQARRLFSEAWDLAINCGEDHFVVEIALLMATTEPQKSQQKWIERAIEIAEVSSLPKSKYWLGELYTSLGWKLFELRQYEKSLEAFHKSLRNLESQGAVHEIFVAQWSIGKVLRVLGRTEEALSIQETLLPNLRMGGAYCARLYEELGECLQTLKRTSEAQHYFELAYQGLSNEKWVADNHPLNLKRLKGLGKVK